MIPAPIVAAAIPAIAKLFKSKKHYHLYFWDQVEAAWKFVMDGIPSNVNPVAASYAQSGVPTAVVRNKGAKAAAGSLAPKSPPAGYAAKAAVASDFNLWILAGIAGAVALGAFLLKKRRRG
jgi:hypothetical protein